jgi:DNA primase
MAIIPPHIVDEIMQTARIEEVIGEYVQLKRAGSNLKGLSPFTDEKTPSFVVSPAKQIFKCFSTGKGGSAVSFLMEKEHYSYPEALRWLADKYGIELPEEKPATAEELAAISERESLHIINEFAKEYFRKNLHESEEGIAIGLSYFTERGFTKEIIDKFQLGYCLNVSNDFTDSALAKGYKLEYLEKVGLTKAKDDRHFDFFRGRVLFPIHSVTGRILGFGGRTLINDKKIAKYYNSPESIIYNKSEILYGLHFAKGDIVKYDNCYLCEGYTDVISMFQAGIQNVVSSSGTSLTKEQIRLVKRYTNNITILYDGDAPGIKASFRGIDLILAEGLNVQVLLFPEGEDPDSYSKRVSHIELSEYITDNKQDFISFKADILLADGDDDPIKRATLIREIIHSVSLIPDQITRTVFMQKIAERFNIDESILSNELIQSRNEQAVKNQREVDVPRLLPAFHTKENVLVKPKEKGFPPSEFALMRLLVLYGELAITFKSKDEKGEEEESEISVIEYICNELNEDELNFETPLFAKIHAIYAEGLVANQLTKATYLKRLEDQEIVQFVSSIEVSEPELSRNWLIKHNIQTTRDVDKLQVTIPNAVYSFKLFKIESRIGEIRTELEIKEATLTAEQLNDLISEQIILERIKREFSLQLGRTILR